MSRATLLAMTIALPLGGCGGGRGDMIAYAVELDTAKGIAAFTCKDSSSGNCVFRFDDSAAQPATLTIAKGEVATVTGVDLGGTYCMTTGAPGAACKAEALQAGIQTIHHEKRSAL